MAGGNIPRSLGPLFVQAGAKYHIPPQVLAGVASVETNLGQNRSTSSAGAVGLMQFLRSTAAGIGINPFNDRQAVFGAAKLLNSFGYQRDPLRAIGAYNGGPGNPQYGYAHQVMSEANRLRGQLGPYLGKGGSLGPVSRGQRVTKTRGGLSVTPVSYRAVTKHGFDSVNYNADVGRTIAGNYIASAKDPFSAGAPKTGITKASINAPLFDSGALQTQMPNASDYATAQTQLERIAGRPVTSHPVTVVSGGGHYAPGNAHGYVNPLPGASFSRTDMGVDGTSRVFRAPADSKILVSNASDPGWRGGGYIAGVILNGPDKGKVWYAAEGLSPHVHVGQIVRAGGNIASPRPNPYNGISGNFEWGWAMRSQPGTPLAHGVYTEGAVTAAGRDFRRWLHSLGAHTG